MSGYEQLTGDRRNHQTRLRGHIRVVGLLAFLALLAPLSLFAAQPALFAVGDVHGDFDDFVAILQKTGLIDDMHHWHGGKLTFVQVGDLLDRGPKERQVMDLIMALEPEAKTAGGRVVSLLGNHEVMNIMGDLRYVTPAIYATFADAKSEDRRRSAWREFTKWRAEHAAILVNVPSMLNATEETWMAEHPAGFVEQREAFSPNGEYGKWLRKHDVILKLNGFVFLHGGLDEISAAVGIDAINSRIHDEIKTFDTTRQYLVDQKLVLPFFTLSEITAVARAQIQHEQASGVPADKQLSPHISGFISVGQWMAMAANSPLWFRGYDDWMEQEGDAKVTQILKESDAKAIVVGHTVQRTRQIRSRFGGRVFLIDTGMLSSYFPDGRPSALEMDSDGEIAAQYLDQRVVLKAATPPSSVTPAASTGNTPH